jgi:hypothetical protein
MYIGPQFQLPERAESLHTPVDWQEVASALGAVGRLIGETFEQVATGVGVIFQAFADAFEDSNRSNVYHPQGPVIRSTAFELPDDTPPVGQLLLEEPLTVWSDRQSKIVARAYDEAGKRFLDELTTLS